MSSSKLLGYTYNSCNNCNHDLLCSCSYYDNPRSTNIKTQNLEEQDSRGIKWYKPNYCLSCNRELTCYHCNRCTGPVGWVSGHGCTGTFGYGSNKCNGITGCIGLPLFMNPNAHTSGITGSSGPTGSTQKSTSNANYVCSKLMHCTNCNTSGIITCNQKYCENKYGDNYYCIDMKHSYTCGSCSKLDYGKFNIIKEKKYVTKIINKYDDNYNKCLEEYDNYQKVYSSVQKLKNIKSDDSLLNLVQKYIHLPKLLSDPRITKLPEIDMECLEGFPFKNYEECSYVMRHTGINPDMNILLHLTTNNTESKFLGTDYSKPITNINKPRGFFPSSKKLEILLKKTINLDINQIKTIISFMYSWIYHDLCTAPYEIEFALVQYKAMYYITIMDFDSLCNDDYGNAGLVKNKISQDFYADLCDPACQLGWNKVIKFSES